MIQVPVARHMQMEASTNLVEEAQASSARTVGARHASNHSTMQGSDAMSIPGFFTAADVEVGLWKGHYSRNKNN